MALKPNAVLVEMLADLLADAEAGEITDAFIVLRFADGEYDCMVQSDDVDDMMVQVRTEVIVTMVDFARDPTAH